MEALHEGVAHPDAVDLQEPTPARGLCLRPDDAATSRWGDTSLELQAAQASTRLLSHLERDGSAGAHGEPHLAQRLRTPLPGQIEGDAQPTAGDPLHHDARDAGRPDEPD